MAICSQSMGFALSAMPLAGVLFIAAYFSASNEGAHTGGSLHPKTVTRKMPPNLAVARADQPLSREGGSSTHCHEHFFRNIL